MKHFYNLTLVLLSLFVSAHSQAENAGAAPPPPDAEMNVSADIRVMNNEISHLKDGQKELKEGLKELDRKIDAGYERLGQKIDASYESLGQKIDASYESLGQKIDSMGQRLENKLDVIDQKLDGKAGWTPFGLFAAIFISVVGGMGALFYLLFNRLMDKFSGKS